MTGTRTTGVWISANSATLHRATTHPRAPGGEGHRDEHKRMFFDEVARAIPGDDDLLLVGDGEVVDHFADHVRAEDKRHGHPRRIGVEKERSADRASTAGPPPRLCGIASQTQAAALSPTRWHSGYHRCEEAAKT